MSRTVTVKSDFLKKPRLDLLLIWFTWMCSRCRTRSHHRKHKRGSDNLHTLPIKHCPCDRGRVSSARPCESSVIIENGTYKKRGGDSSSQGEGAKSLTEVADASRYTNSITCGVFGQETLSLNAPAFFLPP